MFVEMAKGRIGLRLPAITGKGHARLSPMQKQANASRH